MLLYGRDVHDWYLVPSTLKSGVYVVSEMKCCITLDGGVATMWSGRA